MIRSIETALPGFVGLREFFRRLPTSFETVPVETADIERFRKGILEIHGTPRDYAETAVWAWFATAKAHEVRRYSDGTWYVRFGVREISQACLSEAERQLSLAFDADANMKFYTLIDGSGILDEDSDVEFQYSDIEGKQLSSPVKAQYKGEQRGQPHHHHKSCAQSKPQPHEPVPAGQQGVHGDAAAQQEAGKYQIPNHSKPPERKKVNYTTIIAPGTIGCKAGICLCLYKEYGW